MQQSEKLDHSQKQSRFCAETKIPLEVIDCVDNGKDPDLYTQQRLASQSDRAHALKGKVDALTVFRNTLFDSFSSLYPEEAAEYSPVDPFRPS